MSIGVGDIIKRIRSEIIPLFEKAVNDSGIRYENSTSFDCRTIKGCTSHDCPVFDSLVSNIRCWQEVGTYCGKTPQGEFVEKFAACKECTVFKTATPTLVEELGEHFNNMMYLLGRQKEEILKNSMALSRLTEELVSTVEQLNSKNREIQNIMIIDQLTGLYNRNHLGRVFDDEMSRHKRSNNPLSIMMADIDKFKSYNDTYGHLEGDRLLAGLGDIIRTNIRKSDKAFRYGGEEFLVIFPYTDLSSAATISERIKNIFKKTTFEVPLKKDGRFETAYRTISIGLNILDNDHDMETFLRQADDALYLAKAKGGDNIVQWSAWYDTRTTI